ncbi:OsmC family peroxiredoxin [Haloferax sp. MBLA0076]|uniref:OsmC family peroxiredoxin n=1 Tax=Haloferax litoreum TaxID=2666140 RepID=A0A6A8GI49_9EURY|nr:MULTISPECIES: OsmC family protein [Haloferax]KAB1194486.1 OsmC family protein [Haloferax sp. CBA1148]MRX23054.1 OsmC family peroxiredoxin [Haloferax litoreum]
MSDIQTSTVSDEGFATTSQVGGFDLQIDALDEEGPNPNATLVATYASCFLPAFRVGGQKTGFDDLGKIQIDADADLDESDDLTEIRFDVYVEADLSDEEFAAIADLAEDICHVHTALRDDLRADVTVVGDAF